jgi:outer membrane protein TolC
VQAQAQVAAAQAQIVAAQAQVAAAAAALDAEVPIMPQFLEANGQLLPALSTFGQMVSRFVYL